MVIQTVDLEYKQTELGKIPADWRYSKFEDVMTGFSSGQTPSRAKPEYYKGDIPWITSGELDYNIITDTLEKITPEAVRNTNLNMIPKGTFLFAITGLEAEGTRGSCAITGIPATTNQSCMALYPKKGVLTTEYLFHFYVGFGKRLALKYCQGTKQQSYTGGTARFLPIIFPPTVEEQSAIVQVLSDTDAIIKSLDKLIEKKKNIKQGAMQELLTGKRHLSVFHEEWEIKKLGEIAAINMGQSPDSKYYNENGEGIPLIQGKADLYNRRSIQRIWTTQITKTCDANDLIMTVRAPVGSVGIATKHSCIGRGVCALKPKNVAGSYLYQLLIFNEKGWSRLEQGSTFTSANSAQINNYELLVSTSREEQSTIAQVLSSMDTEIEYLEQKRDKCRQLKIGLMQQLLTGRIRLK
ncbi:MAG: restriction endonuclease subunit S [Candidatus Hodarchaeota archaeon]